MSTPEQDDVKRRERAQQVALWRYQLICPALDPELSTKARGRKVLLTPAGQESTLGHAPRIEAKKLEQIAMYLKVSYSDADSGTIIAEDELEEGGSDV